MEPQSTKSRIQHIGPFLLPLCLPSHFLSCFPGCSLTVLEDIPQSSRKQDAMGSSHRWLRETGPVCEVLSSTDKPNTGYHSSCTSEVMKSNPRIQGSYLLFNALLLRAISCSFLKFENQKVFSIQCYCHNHEGEWVV